MEYNELIQINNINVLKVDSLDGLFRDPKVLVPLIQNNGNQSQSIFNLLMDSVIRRGDGSIFYNVQQDYVQRISKFISKGEPIKFVFQGLPFKCHNPIETLRRTPDLGELATLQRLLDINETVRQVYAPGVLFTVLTEGNNYLDLFGATKKEADTYINRCKEFSNFIDKNRVINFVDFMELVGDKNKFFELAAAAEELVTSEEIEQFTPVMRRSLPIINKVAFEDLLAVFGFGKSFDKLSEFEKDFSDYIQIGARDLAIKYLGIQKIKKKFDVIGSHFPDSLYVSTTVKPDRYSFHPIHKKTRLYAHHGVPVLGSDKVDIVYFGEIVTNPEIYSAVYVEGDIEDAPFYFLKGKQHIRK